MKIHRVVLNAILLVVVLSVISACAEQDDSTTGAELIPAESESGGVSMEDVYRIRDLLGMQPLPNGHASPDSPRGCAARAGSKNTLHVGVLPATSDRVITMFVRTNRADRITAVGFLQREGEKTIAVLEATQGSSSCVYTDSASVRSTDFASARGFTTLIAIGLNEDSKELVFGTGPAIEKDAAIWWLRLRRGQEVPPDQFKHGEAIAETRETTDGWDVAWLVY